MFTLTILAAKYKMRNANLSLHKSYIIGNLHINPYTTKSFVNASVSLLQHSKTPTGFLDIQIITLVCVSTTVTVVKINKVTMKDWGRGRKSRLN